MIYGYRKSDELYHHGILGQEWGKRNGPPYPLSSDDHSAAEKKAGWKKSLNKNSEENQNGRQSGLLIPRAIKNAYKQLPVGIPIITVGMMADDALDVAASKIKDKSDDKCRDKLPVDDKTGLHLKIKEMTMKEDAKKVNPGYYSAFGGKQNENCTYCSIAYSLRRLGYDVKANDCMPQQLPNVIAKSFIKSPPEQRPLPNTSFRSKISHAEKQQRMDIVCKSLLGDGKDKFGILEIRWKTGWIGHALSYEVKDGKLRIIDPQIGKVYDNPKSFLKHVSLDNSLYYWDTTNSKVNKKSIKEVVR